MSWQALAAIDAVLDDDRYGWRTCHASVLQALAYRADHRTGVTYTGPWLHRRAGVSRATVSRVLADLEMAGVISVVWRPGRAARITLELSTTRVTETRVEGSDPRHTDATPRHTDATPRHADARTCTPDMENDMGAPDTARRLTRAERDALIREGRAQSSG